MFFRSKDANYLNTLVTQTEFFLFIGYDNLTVGAFNGFHSAFFCLNIKL